MPTLPFAFQSQLQQLLADSYPDFLSSLETEVPVSIHYNPHKIVDGFKKKQAVPWYAKGYYLPVRPSFTLDPAFHAGAYYVQEASSMLVAAAFQKLFPAADRPLRVLDLCAAPGGKSTLLASNLPAGSWLLANEVIRSRYQILKYNLSKWGYSNTFISNHDVEDFASLSGFFDLVLVDAPCSGEGLFRKDLAARDEWSPEHVSFCAARQNRILQTAQSLVAPGGALIYSTCTYNKEENDANAENLAKAEDWMYIDLDFPEDWGLEQRAFGYQAYPHRLQGEGFFLSVFRRTDGKTASFKSINRFKKLQALSRKEEVLTQEWVAHSNDFKYFGSKNGNWRALSAPLVADAQLLAHHLPRIEVGTPLGEPKGKSLVPAPEWALSLVCSDLLPQLEVDKETALAYLRKDTPQLEGLSRGWGLIQYQGLNLGWVKGLGNRYNNYYPTHWRIRMR